MASLLLALPALVYYLWYCLAFEHGHLTIPSLSMLERFPRPTLTSIVVVVGWLTFQALLQIAVPGRLIKGPALKNGGRLHYKINGWSAWCVTWAVLVAGALLDLYDPAALVDQSGELLTTANLVAFIFSIYLYWHSRHFGTSAEHVTNNTICDFWNGTTLNPRIADFDLKFFFEARPGLIGWAALDLAFAAKQYQIHGFVSTPMILVCAFQFLYVADYFWHEEAILSTWDIKHENFGWMLCWGDLVWVPFTYSIQAFYLVDHTHDLTWWATAGIVALNVTGFVIFRSANLQKHHFRQEPNRPIWGEPPRVVQSADGALLLASGWWGLSRHMNYFGDILIGASWALPCGFGSALPYFHLAFLVGLLVHRERRDHATCAARYGKAWDDYCSKVRYRIVPGLY